MDIVVRQSDRVSSKIVNVVGDKRCAGVGEPNISAALVICQDKYDVWLPNFLSTC